MPDNAEATATLAAIDAQRSRLRELLLSADTSALAQRTSSGEWSPVENVRHLLFAEQLHFSQLLPEKQQWDSQGLAPHFLANEPPFKTSRHRTDDRYCGGTAGVGRHSCNYRKPRVVPLR